MTDKSDDRVGYLKVILAQGGGNWNDLQKFKCPGFDLGPWPVLRGGRGCSSFELIGSLSKLNMKWTFPPVTRYPSPVEKTYPKLTPIP